MKERVQGDNPPEPVRDDGDGVKQGGEVGHRCQTDPVNVVDVPEEDHQCGEHQPHPHGENKGQEDGNDGVKHGPVEGGAGDEHHHNQGHKGKGKIDEPRNCPGDGKDILGDIHLLHQAGGPQHRAHGKIGGLAEHIEKNLPAKEVDRIVFDVKPEEKGKDNGHHQHGQQRI